MLVKLTRIYPYLAGKVNVTEAKVGIDFTIIAFLLFQL